MISKTLIAIKVFVFLMLLCLNLNTILCESEVIFTETVDGSVDSGNYSYYSYNGNYKLRLVLTTISGDADLYVSQSDSSGRTVKPKFDLNEHDLQSTTCGQDMIHIDQEFRRPISIGVYGHPSHESTQFTLDVIGVEYFDDNDRFDDTLYVSAEDQQFYEEFFGQPFNGFNKVPKNRQKSPNDKSDRTHRSDDGSETWDFVINLLANLLHILIEAIA